MPNDRHWYAWLASMPILTLLASTSLQAQAVIFIPQNQVTTGAKPSALAVADFNNDGKPDLIAANEGAASLSVFRGLGNGFFFSLPDEATGISPRAIAVGDFNQDGRLDLAVANFASNNVSIFLGTGVGTFLFFSNLSVAGPSAIAVADFNGDGKLDIAVAATTPNNVSIFLGTGTGAFVSFSTVAVGTRPVSIAAVDLNGDGIADLAVANSASNDVSILLGLGNGLFLAARNFAAGQLPAYIAVGDFDGNGTIDLAVANATGFSTGTISLLLGLGNGIFLQPRTINAGSNPSFLISGDFNLDGKADLAVANSGSSTISIFLGLGNATFLPPLDFTVGNAPAWISAADLNGDGKPDLLVANSDSNSVSVLINRTATPARPIVTSVVNAASLQAGPISPGELITIFGANLGPSTPAGVQVNTSGLVSTKLAETQVLFDGIPSPLLYAGGGQVNAVVPYGVAGSANTQLTLASGAQTSAAITTNVSESTPALFTVDGSGQGQGAILNQDGSVNAPLSPAARGSVVVLYATGAGATDPSGVDGLVASRTLPVPVLPVSVTMDGKRAQVSYAGAAPGAVAGVMQVNVVVPSGVSSGAIAVVLQVGSANSQPGVTLSVQ